MKDVTETCVLCKESVAFGSGNFVNRIGADEGWLCAMCAGYICDECDTKIYLDTEVRVISKYGAPMNYHYFCYNEKLHGVAEYGAQEEHAK